MKLKEHSYEKDLSSFPPDTKKRMLGVGVVVDDLSQRSGTFVQIDHSVVHSASQQDGLEVMSSLEALEKYPWLKDYWWHAVPLDTDKFTTYIDSHQHQGCFIMASPGVKASRPLQACLYLAQPHLAQKVHNVIIAEEGSELHLITGCTTSLMKDPGSHFAVSEFYIKKRAKVTFTMIHNWAPKTVVRPRTGAIIEEGGVFISNYVCMRPLRSLQMYPTAQCVGENALVRYNSILVAPPGSMLDVGSRAILGAQGSRAEIISRAITTGGTIIARGHLVGQVPEVKGHLECRGLILSEQGKIQAIPQLDGQVAGVDLSHEAAVGKIAEEEIEYLMMRGLSRAEATAVIVRGFLNVDIEGLPPQLAAELQRAIETSETEVF